MRCVKPVPHPPSFVGRPLPEGEGGERSEPREGGPRWQFLVVALFAIALSPAGLYASPQSTQSSSSPSGSTATKIDPNGPMTAAQGAAILSELRAIRRLLENGAAQQALARGPRGPQPARMRIDPGWHALGNPNAPVIMVEFTDLQCPVCRRFDAGTFAALKKNYIDTGKVRFVSRDLPLPMHEYALGAAEAARCAGDQGKFWQFREAVLTDPTPATPDVLSKRASDLRLDLRQFQSCLNTAKYKAPIEADKNDAATLGLRGTPSFVIGRTDQGWVEGLSMVGARPLPFFEHEIENLLNEPPSGPATTLPAGKTEEPARSGFVGSR